MKISPEGTAFICKFEGYSSKPYKDSVGIATIGFGTITYPNGKKVTMTDSNVDVDTARSYIADHVGRFIEPYLNKWFSVTQEQFDSLCSFVYNLGSGALDKSSLKQDILTGAGCSQVTADFLKWVKAGGETLPGLVARRKAEAKLYCTGQYS